jgi:hypothetical protein
MFKFRPLDVKRATHGSGQGRAKSQRKGRGAMSFVAPMLRKDPAPRDERGKAAREYVFAQRSYSPIIFTSARFGLRPSNSP